MRELKFVTKISILLTVLQLAQAHGGEHHDHSSGSKEHVMSHLKESIGEDDSFEFEEEEELHFLWFRQHDLDDNKQLDGLELAIAISHFENNGVIDEDSITQVIDEILLSDDKNNDGFLNYIEFLEAEKHFF